MEGQVEMQSRDSHTLFGWGVPSCRIDERLRVAILIGLLLVLFPSLAYAYGSRDEFEDPTAKDYFFELVRSSFGTLVMVFCGFGGVATIYMQRSGKTGQQLPGIGIAMLLVAIALFVFRTMITSGLLGNKYLDYGG